MQKKTQLLANQVLQQICQTKAVVLNSYRFPLFFYDSSLVENTGEVDFLNVEAIESGDVLEDVEHVFGVFLEHHAVAPLPHFLEAVHARIDGEGDDAAPFQARIAVP